MRNALQDRKDRCLSRPRQQPGWMTSPPRPIALRRMTWRGSGLPWPVFGRTRLQFQICLRRFATGGRDRTALKQRATPTVSSGPSCNSDGDYSGGGERGPRPVHSRAARRAQFHRAGMQQLRTGADGRRASEPSVSGGARRGSGHDRDLGKRSLPASADAIVDAFLNGANHVVVLDHLLNQTAERATLAIPAGTFAEADGTLVSSEGRAQRFYQVFVPEGDIQASWQWLRDAMSAAGRKEAYAPGSTSTM